MHSFTIAIDRKSLLREANRIIREHEDYMHRKDRYLFFAVSFFSMSMEYLRARPPPSLICSSILLMFCRKNIIWQTDIARPVIANAAMRAAPFGRSGGHRG